MHAPNLSVVVPRRHGLTSILAVGMVGLTVLASMPAVAADYAFSLLGTSADISVVATDVNSAGTVVGYASDNLTGAATAFQVVAGVRTALTGPAGAISTDLVGITDAGTMVGNYATTLEDDGFGNLFVGTSRMFRLSGGVYSDISIAGLESAILGGVSANGRWLVGSTADAQGVFSGFAYDTQDGVLTRFGSDNGATTIAAGVNNLGVVVGYDRVFNTGVGTTGPGWTVDLATGLRTEFQVAGSQRSGPRDITDAGVISGYYYTSLRPAVAHGFTGLNGQFAFFDVPGAGQTFVLGANDAGTLVGQYLDADGNFGAFQAVPVPEPATAALLLAGLAGITGMARRQRRAADAP